MLLQIPHRFLAEECRKEGISLPSSGDYAVGMVFLPADAAERATCERIVESKLTIRPEAFLGWRTVPTNPDVIGSEARSTLPVVRQFFIARGEHEPEVFERKLYF